MQDNLPEISKAVDLQDAQGGINVMEQKVGLRLLVETDNETWEMTFTAVVDRLPVVQLKSSKWKNAINVIFSGSTWGGSTLRQTWIGKGMYMEFWLGRNKRLITSAVKCATLFQEGYHYKMEWDNA